MKQQAKTICLFLIALNATGIIFYNCSKINADGSQAYLNQSPSDAFLQVPAHSNPIFSRIAAAIRAQNSQQHFLNNIAVKEGIPRWEGSTILANAADVRSAAAGSANSSSGVSADTVVLVPLVKANTTYVNSFLACKVNDTVTIRLFRGRDYAKFGFGTSTNGLTAESMAMQMMALQKQSFGHRMFTIGDKRLFNRLANGKVPKRTFVKIGKEPVQCAAPANTNNVLSLTVPVTTTTCEDIWVSNDDGEVVGCPPGDPNCNGGHYETQCQSTTYWIDIIDDAGGGGVPLDDGNNNNNNNNPNGNGGSNNTGNTGSPECPDGNWWCALSDYRILNGIVVTEEFFPGVELGYPWLWWEKPVLSDGIASINDNGSFWDDLNTLSTSTQRFGTEQLRNLCKARKWDVGVDQITFNKKVGKAFEETALQYFGLKENRVNFNAPERAQRNYPNLPTQVRPDAKESFTLVWNEGNNGAAHIERLENFFMAEVKAYSGTLELSTNKYQILGELEAVKKAWDKVMNDPYFMAIQPPINRMTNAPVLVFITTDDTEIGQSIIDEAKAKGVNIWQSKAKWDPVLNKISFESPRFVYSKDPSNLKGTGVPIGVLNALFQIISQEIQMYLLDPVTPNFDLDPESLD